MRLYKSVRYIPDGMFNSCNTIINYSHNKNYTNVRLTMNINCATGTLVKRRHFCYLFDRLLLYFFIFQLKF